MRPVLLILAVALVAAGAVLALHDIHGTRSSAGATTEQAPAAPLPGPAAGTHRSVGDTARPLRLEIPRIGLDRSLLLLGLTRDGELQVPAFSQAGHPGWYRYSPTPGDVGPAVIAGHVDTTTGPAVFYNLSVLHRGDTIRVTRTDHRTAIFRVTRVHAFPKAHFPTHQVYGAIRSRGLRLITCGGPYDASHGGYQDNTIVFATLVRLVPTRA